MSGVLAPPVLQSGTVTPRQLVVWTTDGVIQDAGTPSNPLVGGGLGFVSANDQSFTVYNAPKTGPGSYLSLGISPTAANLTVQNYNGGAALPFNIIVNGQTFPFPGPTGPFLPLSGGTLSGPGNLAVTGTLGVTGATTVSSTLTASGNTRSPSFQAQTTFHLSGVQVVGQYGYYENMTFDGSVSSGQVSVNLWGISDTVDATSSTDGALRGFRINHATLAGFKGGRYTFHSDLFVAGTSGNTTTQSKQYASAFLKANANVNDGGTSPTINGASAGGLTAANPMATLSSGATSWNYLTGVEVDISVHAGASVYNKTGIVIVDQDAALGHQGGGVDRAFALTQGFWRSGIQYGGIGGGWPMDTTNGVLLNILPQFFTATPGVQFVTPVGLHGIDLSWFEPSGNAFASMGFSVQKDSMLIGPGKFSASGGAVSIDVVNKYVSSAAVAGGSGANNVVGDRLYGTDGFGDVYAVATLGGGGSVATVTVVEAGSATGSPAANVTTVGGSGGAQAVVLTRTWTQATDLSIQPTSGGKLGFNGATPIVKPTGVAVTAAGIHAALTSLGLIAP